MTDLEERERVELQLGDRYQIVRTLGTGAFGAVYLARERDLHRLVAIKVLRADRAGSDEERARLLHEARTIANLSHPAVVPLLAYGESGGFVYMVMPYVAGETLADRLREGERFEADEVRRVLIETADALAYLHGEGVLHRDLKPENVLLERAGAVDDHVPPRVRLIDFGVAAFPMRDLGVNAEYETWGTPHFMSPEQMFGEPALDARSEVYSLGVLGFLLLGNRLPFDATSTTERLAQQRKGPTVPLNVCAPDAPRDLVSAIERCLAFDVEQRWRRARDFRDVLVAGAEPTGSLAPLSVVRQRLRPKRASVERLAARRRNARVDSLPRTMRFAEGLSGIGADLRFAARVLRKTPGFSTAIILILAIGLGATTAVLSAVEALIVRPLPVADPGALVELQEKRSGPNQTMNFGASAFRYDRYLAFREPTAGIFTGIAAQNYEAFSVRMGDRAQSVMGLSTSGSYFDVLGIRPALGRFYTSALDRPGGAEPVAVVGYDFWRMSLGADSSVIGRTMFIDSRPMKVVAVAPPGFKGAIGAFFSIDMWVPAPAYEAAPVRDATRPGDKASEAQGVYWMNIFGRLRPGVTVRGASEALRVIAPRVPTEDPSTRIRDAWAEPVRALPVVYQSLVDRFIGILFAVALLVLLIAASNTAGMLLARATARRREVATRLAVGASRARVMRQLVAESVLLCALGGAAGVSLALWLSRFINLYQPLPLKTDVTFGVNWLVLAASAVIVLGAGLVAGLAPAFQGTAVDLATALKAGGVQASPRAARLRSAFVVTQIALSVVLLAVGGLFIRSLQKSLDINPGFNPVGVVSGAVNLSAHGYKPDAARAFFATLIERLRSRPEVAAAALANLAPLSGQANYADAHRVGHPEDELPAQWGIADNGLVELLQTQVLAGRTFTSADRATGGGERLAVINRQLATELWPNDPPAAVVGRRFEGLGYHLTVVGVMANGKYGSLQEDLHGYVYMPFAQEPSTNVHVYVRTRTTTADAFRAAREELSRLDPNVAFELPTLLSDDVDKFLAQQRLGARLIATFGVIGVVLAMTGLYGVLAFGVAQRLREFGVRVALGARAADILGLVLRHGLRLVAAGLVVGIVGGLAAGRVVSRYLFGLSPADPITFVVVPALLMMAAIVASLVPARRGAAADPMTSLRAE